MGSITVATAVPPSAVKFTISGRFFRWCSRTFRPIKDQATIDKTTQIFNKFLGPNKTEPQTLDNKDLADAIVTTAKELTDRVTKTDKSNYNEELRKTTEKVANLVLRTRISNDKRTSLSSSISTSFNAIIDGNNKKNRITEIQEKIEQHKSNITDYKERIKRFPKTKESIMTGILGIQSDVTRVKTKNDLEITELTNAIAAISSSDEGRPENANDRNSGMTNISYENAAKAWRQDKEAAAEPLNQQIKELKYDNESDINSRISQLNEQLERAKNEQKNPPKQTDPRIPVHRRSSDQLNSTIQSITEQIEQLEKNKILAEHKKLTYQLKRIESLEASIANSENAVKKLQDELDLLQATPATT